MSSSPHLKIRPQRFARGLSRVLVLCLGLLLTTVYPGEAPAQADAASTIDALVADLKHEDSEVRRRAVAALGEILRTTNEAVLPLIDALDDENAAVREGAIHAIWLIGPSAVGEALMNAPPDVQMRGFQAIQRAQPALMALQRQAEEKRFEAQGGLMPMTPGIDPDLLEDLDSEDPEVRREAEAELLARQRRAGEIPLRSQEGRVPAMPGVDPTLLEDLNDEDPAVRLDAVDALGAIKPTTPAVVLALIETLNDEDKSVHERAADFLAEIGPDAWYDALQFAPPQLQIRTSNTLQAFGDSLFSQDRLLDRDSAQASPQTADQVAALIAALETGDSFARRRALEALGRLGPAAKNAVPAVIEALSSEDASVRESAADALDDIGMAGETAVPALIDALEDSDGGVRAAAASALGGIGPGAKAAVPALIEALNDPDDHMRMTVAEALGGIGPAARDAIPALIQAMRSGDTFFRMSAESALNDIGPAAPEAIPALLDALSGDDVEVRKQAAGALGGIEPTTPEIVRTLFDLLSDEDSGIRQAAAWSLPKDPLVLEAVPGLVARLEHDDREIRRDAAMALGTIAPQTETAIEAVIQALSDPNREVQNAAVGAVAQIGPAADEAVPILIESLRNAGEDDTWIYVDALPHMGPAASDAIPVLIEKLEIEGGAGPMAVGFALGRIATIARDAGDAAVLDDLKSAQAALLAIDHAQASESAKEVARAIEYLELQRRNLASEVILSWIEKHPVASLLIAAYPLWLLLCLLIFWLRPLAILPINRALRPLDYKLPGWLGGAKVPLRFLLCIGFLDHRNRVLDAWVKSRVATVRERFEEIRTVADRATHVDIPVVLDGRTLPTLDGKDLGPTFRKQLGCLLIWGEGGAGKTSIACQAGKWAMAELPEARLADHLMLPVLVEDELDAEPDEGKDSFTQAIGRQLQILIDAPEPIDEELLHRLLRRQRILVIVDHLSEMSEATRSKIRPSAPKFPVNALIVTSRLEEAIGGLTPTVLQPIRIAGNRLSSFMEAYLTRRQKRSLFDDRTFFDACARLSGMVGKREITALLAKLYAEQMIANQQHTEDLPQTVPDLMLAYLNELNRNVAEGRREDRLVHSDAKATAWACVMRSYRPEPAPLNEVLAALGGDDAQTRLDYLEDRLRVVQTIAPAHDRCRLLLDPLAEYLAGLHVVESCNGRAQDWSRFLARADAMPGAPAATKGFLLAVHDCCLARQRDLKIPSFLADEILKRAGEGRQAPAESRVA